MISLTLEKGRSGTLTAGIVLLIIDSCYVAVMGVVFSIVGGFFVILGILGIIGFSFGLTGSILALKRRVFPLVIIGNCFVIAFSIANLSVLTVGWYIFGAIFSLPTLILSILSLTFITIRKSEFIKTIKK